MRQARRTRHFARSAKRVRSARRGKEKKPKASRAWRKMPRSPRLPHKAPVVQATVDVIRRSRGLNATEFKRFFFVVCGPLIPFTTVGLTLRLWD